MAASKPSFEINKSRCRRARCSFVDKMHDIPSFLDHALVLKFFTTEHKSIVESKEGDNDKRRKVHDFLLTKFFDYPNEILEALVKSGNIFLAMKLVPEETKKSDLEKAFNVKIDSTENKHQIVNFMDYRVEFVKYMSDIPTFLDNALEKNLLSTQDKNDIRSKKNIDNQTRTMCDIMDRKLPEKSDGFLYALTKSGNDYLVELLLTGTGMTFDIGEPDTINTTRSVDGEYPMKIRGRVVIIENTIFGDPKLYREGSHLDREKVETFFNERSYEVIHKHNLKAGQMETDLKKQITDEKGVGEDIFILFILSHGCESGIAGTDLKKMNYSVIFQAFEGCDIWKDKPKLIYIQACQNVKESGISSYIPSDGHFYVMYSTIPGGSAYRSPDAGSRLIQSVIDVYSEKSESEDVEAMGIEIKRRIFNPPGGIGKQIPLCHSSLVKRVYLKRPA